MNKKLLIGMVSIVMIVIILIIVPILLTNLYNYYAEKQRDSIRYCIVDEDCITQIYDNSCGAWSGCFNKNEKPANDIGFQTAFCDYPPSSCKCENKKCRECLGTFCFK